MEAKQTTMSSSDEDACQTRSAKITEKALPEEKQSPTPVTTLSELLASINDLKAALTAGLEDVKKDIKVFKEEFYEFRGDSMERVLRERIAADYGSDFSASFTICGLAGLGRMMVGRKTAYAPTLLSDRTESDSDLQLQEQSVSSLRSYLYSNASVHKLIAFILGDKYIHVKPEDLKQKYRIMAFSHGSKEESARQHPKEEVIRRLEGALKAEDEKNSAQKRVNSTLSSILNTLLSFVRADKGQQFHMLGSDSGLSMLAASMEAGIDFPVHELQLDVRGRFQSLQQGKQLLIHVGEIKANARLVHDGANQLDRVHRFFKWAASVLHPNARMDFVGYIFVPHSSRLIETPQRARGSQYEWTPVVQQL